MKIIDRINNIGKGIKAIYQRLGEVDCPDELNAEQVLAKDANYAELQKAQKLANEMYQSLGNNSSAPKGGKGNSFVKKVELTQNKVELSNNQTVTRKVEDRERD